MRHAIPRDSAMTYFILKYFLTFLFTFHVVSGHVGMRVWREDDNEGHLPCQPVIIPMCRDMPYNVTMMPNLLQHRTQDEAAIMAHEFLPLVNIGCSTHLRFFICSVFAPMCSEKFSFGVPSCRSVCKSVKKSCLPFLRRMKFSWPSFLKCSSFPEGGVCMIPPDLQKTALDVQEDAFGSDSKNAFGSGSKNVFGSDSKNVFGSDSKNVFGSDSKNAFGSDSKDSDSKNTFAGGSKCQKYQVSVQSNDGVTCAPICGVDYLYSADDKEYAVATAAAMAFICFGLALFTLVTFSLDFERFAYPIRPVVFMAFSYLCYSVPFIARFVSTSAAMSCQSNSGLLHLAVPGGATSMGCIFTFIFQYYFNTSAHLWWLILTLGWFLSSVRLWSSEGLLAYSKYFHGAAWGAPAVATIIAISTSKVDGDELLGMCHLGNTNSNVYLYMVVIPHTLLVTIGTTLSVCGFLALFKVTKGLKENALEDSNDALFDMPKNNAKIRRLSNHVKILNSFMLRMGVFAVSCTAPEIFVCGAQIFQYMNYDSWVIEASSRICPYNQSGLNQNQNSLVGFQGCSLGKSVPPFNLILTRILATLLLGSVPAIWICSTKTVVTWKSKLFGRPKWTKTYTRSTIITPAAETENTSALYSPYEKSVTLASYL